MILIDHQDISGGKIAQLTLRGKLDTETAGDFESFVAELIRKGRRYFLINIEELDYCSSAGIGLLLYLQKKVISHGGLITISGASDEFITIFSIFGLDRIIALTENPQEGISLLEKNIQFNRSSGKEKMNFPSSIDGIPRKVEVYEIKDEEESKLYNEQRGDYNGRTPVELKEVVVDVEQKGSVDFASPLIVECAECGTFTRVVRSGAYLCPECHAEFTVEKDQTIIF
ncbi:MAG: STAS domain-containing protein [Spirochaetes bacterium]|nr:STAS domain-containing protein [Spirochaetota bacterium]